MKDIILTKISDVILGKVYSHDGMSGIAESYNGQIRVKSGTDGFFPRDVIKWGGNLDEVILIQTNKTK